MSIFNRIISSISSPKTTNPFDRAPNLFPWYFSEDNSFLTRNGRQLNWRYVERIDDEYVGQVTLNESKSLLAAFEIYTYLLPVKNGTGFCVWKQDRREGHPASTILFELFDTAALKIIDNEDDALLTFFRDQESTYLINASPTAQCEVKLTDAQEIEFPKEFIEIDDFIAVVSVPNLYPDKAGVNETAFLEISPKKGTVSLYPQDWFNLDTTLDFGYQWITRAVRDPNTGTILGQGIRIDDFKLDETNRQRLS